MCESLSWGRPHIVDLSERLCSVVYNIKNTSADRHSVCKNIILFHSIWSYSIIINITVNASDIRINPY